MQLSEHFTVEEATVSDTAARLGITNQPNEEQLSNMRIAAEKLELLRKYVGKPIHVSSWLRVPALNIVIPGATNTPAGHSSGFCIDCRVNGITPYDLCFLAANLYDTTNIPYDQIILEYNSWMHISFHPQSRKELLTIYRTKQKRGFMSGILTLEEYLG